MTYTIKTSNPVFRGERNGLKFLEGAATTEDRNLAAQFADAGFEVSPPPAPPSPNGQKPKPAKPPGPPHPPKPAGPPPFA